MRSGSLTGACSRARITEAIASIILAEAARSPSYGYASGYTGLMAATPPSPSDQVYISRTAISTGVAQLSATLTALDTDDLKALALMAFDAGLMAALIAAGSTDLGRRWYLGIIGLSLSILFAGGALVTRDRRVGPSPRDFFNRYWESSELEANIQLIAALNEAISYDRREEQRKSTMLAWGGAILVPTAVYAAFVFALWR